MKTANIFTPKGALLAGSLVIASAMFSAMPAHAAEKSLELTDKTNSGAGDYPTVTVDLKDVPGGVEVTVNVNDGPTGYTGDLRGVWFDLPNPGGVTVSGVGGGPVTGITGAANATSKGVSNSGELSGMKATFNLGVEIGSQGLKGGSDDFQTATFTLSGVSVADFSSDVIGTRLMSVGNDSNGRGLSSKTGSSAIEGNYDTETSSGGSTGGGDYGGVADEPSGDGGSTVGGGDYGDGGGIINSEAAPEPLTIAGTILGGGALLGLRKRKGNKTS
jgi:hypothetical protein